eukprot:maker-scaffold11_size778918-snap-gene-5.21 protein:Tk03671 transcript:maker-scaffold11_size778918-snap-gene-5.21-mRNA-1 annotation:"hypothetical protein DAPPUDRAFT_324689"
MEMKCLCLTLLTLLVSVDWTESKQGDLGPNPHKTCPEGYELYYDRSARKYECVCQKYHIYWPEDGICYREYYQGPCPEGHRLVRNETTRQPYCACPFFSAQYEPDGICYQEYTQGPCEDGELIMADRNTGKGVCSCDSSLTMYYHKDSQKCYELYKQGPCPEGHILSFNYATFEPQCKCQDGYHLHSDGNCYKLNTQGPCEDELKQCEGTPCFMKSLEAIDIKCTCLPKNSMTETHQCYQPYTRGPCNFGDWLVFKKDGTSECQDKKYCKRFDNWHWWSPHQRCYRQFSQGPCKKGKLFYLDTDEGGTGCYCKKDWEVYYWNQTGECFEQESPGPCPEGQYFAYNATSKSTECSCFKNYVLNPESGTCVEQFSQGNCPRGQLVTVGPDGTMKCDCGPQMRNHYWPLENACYPHYERGPCAKGEQFRIHPIEKRPSCIVWGRTSYARRYYKK